jgi:UDP-hydrolysing UDP-N-acetyl-D-glucosamine 2-epimerase
MISKRKVCVVITARPSYARIKTALLAIMRDPDMELQLVVGASALLERYGPVIDVIRADGFTPNSVVYMVVEGENLVTSAKSTGLGIVELATIFDNLKPDIVLSIADRYETIATAIAASYLNIPVAHVQGGEVTGSIDEKVRHAVTKLSNIHLVATEQARERVIKMGEQPKTVYITGCPSVDIAAKVVEQGPESEDFFEKHPGVGERFDLSNGYLVVMQHSVTNRYASALEQIRQTLIAIETLKMPTLWFWPNVDAGSDGISKGIRQFRETHRLPFVYFLKNLPPEDFLSLISHSRALIGNSSVGIRESAFLGVPVVNIGDRQQGRERGPNVIDVASNTDEIYAAIRKQVAHGRYHRSTIYGDGKAGQRIADVLSTVDLDIEKQLAY